MSSSWFAEIPSDETALPQATTSTLNDTTFSSSSSTSSFLASDREFEAKITKLADRCCFAQYFVDKVASATNAVPINTTASSSKSPLRRAFPVSTTATTASVIKVHVLDNSGLEPPPKSSPTQQQPQRMNQQRDKKSSRSPSRSVGGNHSPRKEQTDSSELLAAARDGVSNENIRNDDKDEGADHEHDDDDHLALDRETENDRQRQRRASSSSQTRSSSVSSTASSSATSTSFKNRDGRRGPVATTAASSDQQGFKARYFSQTVSSYFSKFTASENQQQQSSSSSNHPSLQNIVPEDAFLRPIPISTSLVSSSININNNNNNNRANASSNPQHPSSSSYPSSAPVPQQHQPQYQQQQQQFLPLRKQYEPQIQTLEINNLPGFVVFADVVLLESDTTNICHTPGAGGRFLLLSSHPLFATTTTTSSEEKEEGADEVNEESSTTTTTTRQQQQQRQHPSVQGAASSSLSKQQQHQETSNRSSTSGVFTKMRFADQPTGWRILYFAPKNAQVRLRVVILKKSCDLIRNGLIDVRAFGSNEKAPSGATRCCVDPTPTLTNNNNRWIVTCGGGGTGNFQSPTCSIKNRASLIQENDAAATSSHHQLLLTPALPLNFLRPVGIIETSSTTTTKNENSSSSFIITGFEVGITTASVSHGSQNNNISSNALAGLLLNLYSSTQAQQKNAMRHFDQNLFAWVIAVRAKSALDSNNTNPNNLEVGDDSKQFLSAAKVTNIESNLSSCLSDSAFNLSWSLSINVEVDDAAVSSKDARALNVRSCCCDGDDGSPDNNSSIATEQHSITLSTGQLPSSSPQILSAKTKWNAWLLQYQIASSSSTSSHYHHQQQSGMNLNSSSSFSSASPSSPSSELKGVPPEFWHAQRRVNSQNIVKKGFTDIILSQ